MEIKQRKESIKMNGKKCQFGSTSVFDCHCNECYNNIIEYLGKEVGKVYL